MYHIISSSESLIALGKTLSLVDYPFSDTDGIAVYAELTAEKHVISVHYQEDGWHVSAPTVAAAARGLGMVLAEQEGDFSVQFQVMGILLDCSRGKVFHETFLKKFCAQSALLGYNLLSLYTEDTYKMDDEPFFGYCRGGYDIPTLQRLDDFTAALGMELTGAIQTLGHLASMLHWGAAYAQVTDTEKNLLVDEPKTYELIENMLSFWSKALRSRRIHLGMDEAPEIGRGRFMNLHGYEPQMSLMSRHLKKVSELCRKYGYEVPSIWSDLYFKLDNPDNPEQKSFYSETPKIHDAVKAQIPESVQLCHWDYYHDKTAFYENYLREHQKAVSTPVQMVSGVWCWAKLWYDAARTEQTVRPCVEACRNLNIPEIIFSIWGDMGATCQFSSSMAGLAYAAGECFDDTEKERIASLYHAVTNDDYELCLAVSRLEGEMKDKMQEYWTQFILLDDPIYWIHMKGEEAAEADFTEKYLAILKNIAEILEDSHMNGRYDYRTMLLLCRFLIKKCDYRLDLLAGKSALDLSRLIPAIEQSLKEYIEQFQKAWQEEAAYFGLEVNEYRLGGQLLRWETLRKRLSSGEIPEDVLEGRTPAAMPYDELIFKVSGSPIY